MTRILASTRVWRVVLVGLVVLVGCLALVPVPPHAMTTGWDKLNHASAFAALALAARLAFPARTRDAWATASALLAYGALIEIAQLFVPGRAAEWADLLGDAVGVATGMALAAWLLLRLRVGPRTGRAAE
jgi:VanZ family protein